MIQAILFMAIVPLAILLVLAFTLLSGRMSDSMRDRVQRALILTVYPLLILHWLWQAWERWQTAEWLGLGMYIAIAALFAVQFVISLRTGVLFPRFRTPRA
ncbi:MULTISPECIES: hypothetical protein [unclassified Brevundimonas]|uniref:hypothetical protein n=1 Tax=unclassified Brevundimonas TaxID=2622653 RepID=UPI0006FCE9CD|nr:MULTISPECIES: hypothetical protein [unclassified Brevundimonas]KQY82501.1 hypothetical protein ASD25_25210 [Brevundimonas sp. Root1423]KRA26850.1 hypothetical protein ASD59_05810 [Brevundimonas sp. Root608]